MMTRRSGRMRALEAELGEARRTIEYLRAKLCMGEHSYVIVEERKSYTNMGCAVGLEICSTYICTRCGHRKVEER